MTRSLAATKRALDVTLVLLTLPLWGTLLALLAALVLLCDGRPVFFPQPRVGGRGRPFIIWKLRSMTLHPLVTSRRPTRLGHYLRLHGLDELPQLLNVLWGDMALVGPRPLQPSGLARLAGSCPQFAAVLPHRLTMPPGLTGLAQVCLARGPALTAALDGHYARRWTPTLDLAILLRTAWINLVGKRRGARQLPDGLTDRSPAP